MMAVAVMVMVLDMIEKSRLAAAITESDREDLGTLFLLTPHSWVSRLSERESVNSPYHRELIIHAWKKG